MGAGQSHWNSNAAFAEPNICARINIEASIARIPVKVSVSAQAIVSAGLANDVDDVNQYPAVI